MNKPWDIERLDQVAEVVGRGIAPKYDDHGDFLVVNQRCIRDGRVSLDNARRHNSGARKVKADKVLSAGDVLVNSTGVGTLGRTAPIREVQSLITADSHVTILRPLPEVSSQWFAYAVSALEAEIENLAEGSTGQTELSRHRLADLELTVPPLLEQRAIAATLGALDDKIESNRRAMARLDELFHAMWRREYDGIPVEAEVPLSEHVTTQYGLTASASSDADGDKFLRVTDINKQNWIDWTGVPFAPTDDSLRAKYSLNKGDLLVARMADPGKSAIYDGGPTAVFASYLVRLKPSSYEEALFIYGFLKSSEYLDYAAGAMTGSVQKNMNAKVIVAASLRWPDSSALSRFAEHAGPLRDKIAQIVEESARLSALRDALLPELLSGRIRAADVEVA